MISKWFMVGAGSSNLVKEIFGMDFFCPLLLVSNYVQYHVFQHSTFRLNTLCLLLTVLCLGFYLQCFDDVGLVTGRSSDPEKQLLQNP